MHMVSLANKQTPKAQTGYYHSTASALQHQWRLVPQWPSITQHTAQVCREPSIFSLHLPSLSLLSSHSRFLIILIYLWPSPEVSAVLSWFFIFCPLSLSQSLSPEFLLWLYHFYNSSVGSSLSQGYRCTTPSLPPFTQTISNFFPTLASISPFPHSSSISPFLLSITYSVVAVKSTPGRLICWWQIAVN